MASANSFGSIFKFTSFGESHGVAMGAVIEGCPSGIEFNEKLLLSELNRRRPGSGSLVSSRAEADHPEVLSGVYDGLTLGTPIAVVIRNSDARSQDYALLSPRAGHADDVWKNKFGHSDPRGGGRSSGRETVSRVIAGAFAQMVVHKSHAPVEVVGFATQIGPIALSSSREQQILESLKLSEVDSLPARFADSSQSTHIINLLSQAKESGKSYGGTALVVIRNMIPNLGQPVFHKLKSDIAAACMSVGAVSGVEIGDGFSAAEQEGSDFHTRAGSARYGGIRGGISTGENIVIRIGFKPTSSVLDIAKKGRHDPCIVPRAIPVLESMIWCVLADHLLWARLDRS